MRPKSLISVSFVLFLTVVCGCTPLSLSSMQSGMNDLAFEKEKLIQEGKVSRPSGARATGSVVSSLPQIDSNLMGIADEAEELAESPGTSKRAAISAWRIAVHAAWLALPVDTETTDAKPASRALELADKGVKACEAVDTEGSFTNPRDCALMQFAPAQIAFQVHWEKYKRLNSRPKPFAQDFFDEARILFSDFKTAVWKAAWDKGALAKTYAGIDATVTEFIDDEKFIFMCAALIRFPTLNRNHPPAAGAEASKNQAVEAYRDLRRALASRYDLTVDELETQKTPECTTRLTGRGLSS